MRNIWERSRVFMHDAQDIPIYKYACESSEATWDPSASLFVSLTSFITQRSSVGLGKCVHQFLGVCHLYYCRSEASIIFYEADDPIGVVSFHRHLFIGLNFLVKNTLISCPLLCDFIGYN